MRVHRGSWRLSDGQFVGNECAFPLGGTFHGCKQLHVNQFVIEEARRLKGRLTLSLDAHFVRPETKMIQDIMLQSGNKNGWRASSAYYQMNTAQAREAWLTHHRLLPNAHSLFEEALEGNTTIVSMVEPITIPKTYHLPEVEFPYSISSQAEMTRDQKLQALLMQRIRELGRMPGEEPRRTQYFERLAKEINVIAYNGKINFLPYFLNIDQDICQFARDNEIPIGPGRGSAAGSLLSYLLGITHIDPIIWELSFERFLSMGRIARGKFPDIDIDLANPKVIADRLADKYGEKFARICTTGTMKLKGAIRDISRILLNTGEKPAMAERVNAVCNTIENMPQGADTKKWLHGYEDGEGYHAGQLETNEILRGFLEEFEEVGNALDEVLDVPRSVGRHASAYCLSDEALTNLVPMCEIGQGEEKEICTQFTMGPVEALGLIKMDLLGLNTLKDIAGCVKLIRKRLGIEIDIYTMDYEKRPPGSTTMGININDPDCFDAFCTGRTETVFQFKSAIATKLCQQVRPRSLLDLANITANGRPGTMYALLEDKKTTLIDAWVARRQKRMPVTYSHPDLEEILKVTEGIFTYQEQIMAAFVKCCGYTEERADEIREIIGKKQLEKMEAILPEIRAKLAERLWKQDQIDSFISLCVAASNYSFNKSHSVAYAYIGYICMWLKTNFHLEWWNSVLENSNQDDLKDAAKYVRDIVVPPHVNTSLLDFYIVDEGLGKLIFPLNRVKNVKGAGEYIWKARHTIPERILPAPADGSCVERESQEEIPFENFEDFYNRVDRRKVNKRVVASLIWAGAFDRLCSAQAIQDRNKIYRDYLGLKKEKIGDFVDLTEEELMKRQMEMLAIGSANFVELLRKKTGWNILDPGDITRFPKDTMVRVGGLSLRVKKIITKEKKQPMAFIDIGNESNEVSITVFPKEYELFKERCKEQELMVVTGKINIYQGRTGVIADAIYLISDSDPTLEEGPIEPE